MILFVGGVRSGKSALAQQWAERQSAQRLYLATCMSGDAEMLERVEAHRKARDSSWRCIEEGIRPMAALRKFLRECPHFKGPLLLDSLDMLLANLLSRNSDAKNVELEVAAMLEGLKGTGLPCAIVSAECGMGFVPMNPLARKFGDALGKANQLAAEICDTVVVVHCGLPLRIKGEAI